MVRRLAITAIIAICLGGPIVEMCDRWDQTVQDGNDTEADVVVAALCIGVAFAVGTTVVVNRICSLSFSTSATSLIEPQMAVLDIASVLAATPASSPPAILRV
jgi:hypothetical protein